MAENQLEQIASDLVERATRAGASAADVVVREGDEFSTTVRLGKIESLKEAASKALGLRAFLGARSATAFSSDFSPQSLSRLVERTIAMARVTSEDPASGLPDRELLGSYPGDPSPLGNELSGRVSAVGRYSLRHAGSEKGSLRRSIGPFRPG